MLKKMFMMHCSKKPWMIIYNIPSLDATWACLTVLSLHQVDIFAHQLCHLSLYDVPHQARMALYSVHNYSHINSLHNYYHTGALLGAHRL